MRRFTVSCPACLHMFSIAEEAAGEPGHCPQCKEEIMMPREDGFASRGYLTSRQRQKREREHGWEQFAARGPFFKKLVRLGSAIGTAYATVAEEGPRVVWYFLQRLPLALMGAGIVLVVLRNPAGFLFLASGMLSAFLLLPYRQFRVLRTDTDASFLDLLGILTLVWAPLTLAAGMYLLLHPFGSAHQALPSQPVPWSAWALAEGVGFLEFLLLAVLSSLVLWTVTRVAVPDPNDTIENSSLLECLELSYFHLGCLVFPFFVLLVVPSLCIIKLARYLHDEDWI